MMTETEFKFDVSNRNELKRCGLNKAQIDEMEKVLPICRGLLTKAAPLSDVRKEIQALQMVAAKTEKTISLLVNSPPENKARWEARYRLLKSLPDSLEDIEKMKSVLRTVQAIAACALKDTGTDQRRHFTADPLPVRLIDEALERGFRGYYHDMPPFPPYNVHPSKRHNSKYFRIIRICYTAMTGDSDVNPERAITEFIKQRNAEQARVVELREMRIEQLEKEIAELEEELRKRDSSPKN